MVRHLLKCTSISPAIVSHSMYTIFQQQIYRQVQDCSKNNAHSEMPLDVIPTAKSGAHKVY